MWSDGSFQEAGRAPARFTCLVLCLSESAKVGMRRGQEPPTKSDLEASTTRVSCEMDEFNAFDLFTRMVSLPPYQHLKSLLFGTSFGRQSSTCDVPLPCFPLSTQLFFDGSWNSLIAGSRFGVLQLSNGFVV